jgi:hypothetical protein
MSEPIPELGHSLNETADHGESVAADAGRRANRRDASESGAAETAVQAVREIGGPNGLEPTRYGDWEHKGRCIDF